MDAAFATWCEFEMFHRIGDIGLRPVQPRLCCDLVKKLPCRADKGPPAQVFLVTGLFADNHQLGTHRPFPRHGLGRVAMQRATRASGDGCG